MSSPLAFVVVALAMASAPPHAPPHRARPRLVVLDVNTKDSTVPPAARSGLLDALAVEAGRWEGVEVSSISEIRAAMKLVAERDQAGCDSDGCAAELADAFGARYVLFSALSRLGSTWSLTLSLYDSHEARVVGRGAVTATTLPSLSAVLTAPLDEALAALSALGKPKARIKRPSASVADDPDAGAGRARQGAAALDVDDVPVDEEPLSEFDAAACRYEEDADRFSCGGPSVSVLVARSGSASTAGVVRFAPELSRGCPSQFVVDVEGGEGGAVVVWTEAAALYNGRAVPLKPASGIATPVSVAPRSTARETLLPAGGCLGPGDVDTSDVAALTVPFHIRGEPARAMWVRRRAREPRSEADVLALIPQPLIPEPTPDLVTDDPPIVIYAPLGAAAGACVGIFSGAVAAFPLMPRSSTASQRVFVGAGFGSLCGACVGLPAAIGGGFADVARAKSWEEAQGQSASYRLAEKKLVAWKRIPR